MGRGYKAGSGQFAMTSNRFGASRRVYKAGGLEFIKSGSASMSNDEVVFVSVAKLNAMWKKGGDNLYINKGGGGAEIAGRREQFRSFLKTGKAVEMSQVSVRGDGSLIFGDGRHRFSVLRDKGKRIIAVTTSRGASADRLRKLAGAKRQPK